MYATRNPNHERREFVFENEKRNEDDVILGIESSFDDSQACLVNSFGNIMSENVKIKQ